MTPGDLYTALDNLWRSDHRIMAASPQFNSFMRAILVTPITSAPTDLGEFYRITKEVEAQYNPFIYGPLNEEAYISIIESQGSTPTGIRSIRKVVDHIAAFKHRPSNTLASEVVSQCITGHWPKTLLSFLEYLKAEKITIDNEIWSKATVFISNLNGYSQYADEIVDMALKSGCTPEWPLVNSYAESLLRDDAVNHDITNYFVKLNEAIPNFVKLEDEAEREAEVLKLQNELFGDFLVFWVSNNLFDSAIELLDRYIQLKKVMNDKIFEMSFLIVQRKRDATKFKLYYDMLKTDQNVQLTTRLVATMIKAVAELSHDNIRSLYELQDLLLAEEAALYSAYGANMMMHALGKYEDWSGLDKFIGVCRTKDLKMNSTAALILEKHLTKCYDHNTKASLRDHLRHLRTLDSEPEEQPT